jgi:DHA1 family bicyclomycin/chloramphenicol resistance-like MFS transporter
MAGDAGARGARDMALLTAIVMLSPMLAPLLGSALQNLAGWRSIFAVLASAAALCGLAALFRVPETCAIGGASTTGSPASWAGIVIEAGFARNLALSTALSGGLYIFLTASPFLLVETYHADPRGLGIYYGLVALGAGSGAFASSRLAGGWAIDRLIRVGTAIAAAGAFSLAGTALLGWRESLGLIVPMMIFAFGGGLVIPNAMIAALAANRQRIGTAVSAFGAIQMLGNAAITSTIAAAAPRNVVIVALGIAGLATFATSLGFQRSVGRSESY